MIKFNENNEVIKKEDYRAFLVGLSWGKERETEKSMEELRGLAEADEIEVCGEAVQSLDRPDQATFIGSGKVEEIAELCRNMDVDMVIFNDELSGMQLRNLEEAFGVRVIDRTILILDIFADRATTKEGKLQVELAQLQYRLPRLTGFGKSLSRLGGGIGTRGPGEKKLETDRRHIQSRIDDIRSELKKAEKTRNVQQSDRKRSGIPIVALVGYTNAGKSAVMNRLISIQHSSSQNILSRYNSSQHNSDRHSACRSDIEGKIVKSKDMLFATLDTSHRNISTGKGKNILLIDTVGFVSKLPHNLVEAFKSTLEEVKYADVLIHIVDSSSEERDFQISVTNKVIAQLGAGEKDTIIAYNKSDIADEIPTEAYGKNAVSISAKTGSGFEELLEILNRKIFGSRIETELLIPYSEGNISSYLCDHAEIEKISYKENGTLIKGRFEEQDYQKYRKYDSVKGDGSL